MVTEKLLVPDDEREKIIRNEELETLRSGVRGAIYHIKDLTTPPEIPLSIITLRSTPMPFPAIPL